MVPKLKLDLSSASSPLKDASAKPSLKLNLAKIDTNATSSSATGATDQTVVVDGGGGGEAKGSAAALFALKSLSATPLSLSQSTPLSNIGSMNYITTFF